MNAQPLLALWASHPFVLARAQAFARTDFYWKQFLAGDCSGLMTFPGEAQRRPQLMRSARHASGVDNSCGMLYLNNLYTRRETRFELPVALAQVRVNAAALDCAATTHEHHSLPAHASRYCYAANEGHNRMSDSPFIRDATGADLAFLADSNAAMALETERKTLDRAVLELGIAAIFERPQRGFYLIAERARLPVGCLLITYEWSDWRNGDWWWLQSVYVAPEARRGGVFRALHTEVERRVRLDPCAVGLRLYVERENRRAQQTYEALGMHETHYRMFEREFDPPADNR